jgi:SAM-dependent methyltransferase
VGEDRERLRNTFDTAASKYARARPSYPEQLFEVLVRVTDLRPGAELLEIGCGTGQATRALAERGFKVTCVELGTNLAVEAARDLAGLADVSVVQADFETWQPPTSYDAVVAATSWKWLDVRVKYDKAWRTLVPGGHLCFWNAAHVFPKDADPFFTELQAVYDEIGEGLPDGAAYPGPTELPDERAELEASGLFDVVAIEHFDWELTYTADEYIALLETFSGHIAMESWQRDKLFAEIRRRLAERRDGTLRRHWGAVLHVARRRDES